jgi:hypothetical protein
MIDWLVAGLAMMRRSARAFLAELDDADATLPPSGDRRTESDSTSGDAASFA